MKRLYATLMILVPLLAISGTADAQSFTGRLSGAQEVPPNPPLIPAGVQSPINGTIDVNFTPNQSLGDFRLEVNNGTGVVAAHLHCGQAGENGPIVLTLFESDAGVNAQGVLAEDDFTNADIEATAAECNATIGRRINTLASVSFAAWDELIYANVHTLANPEGEARAQLRLQAAP
jgi:hypothetical protein